jgi:hypothetical protein
MSAYIRVRIIHKYRSLHSSAHKQQAMTRKTLQYSSHVTISSEILHLKTVSRLTFVYSMLYILPSVPCFFHGPPTDLCSDQVDVLE